MDGINYWNELVGIDGVHELFDIDVDRADLVGYPAIRRKFLLVKSNDKSRQEAEKTQEEHEMDNLIEVLKSLVTQIEDGKFADKAVDLFDRLQKSSNEEDVNGLLDELREALGDNDTITKEQFEEWQAKAEDLVSEEVAEDEEVEKAEDADEVEDTDEAEDVDETDEESEEDEIIFKSDIDLSEADEEPEEDEPVEDEEAEPVEKSLSEKIEKQALELKKAKADFKKAQQEIETLRIEKQRKELVEKASSELSYLGKSADDVGDLLMSLRLAGVPDEIFTGLYDLLKSNSEMIKSSGLFNEIGTSLEPESSDPETKMMNEAQELVEKGEFPTKAQAFAHLYKSNPGALEE